MAQARTLFDKIWDQHVVRSVGESVDLLHVDRHLLHDLSGARALSEVREKGHQVHSPQLAAQRCAIFGFVRHLPSFATQ